MTKLLGILLAACALLMGQSAAARTEAPPLSAYGQLPDVEMASLSPSGKRLAFVATIQGKRALVLSENGQALDTAILNDEKVRSLSWIDENRAILVLSKTERLGMGFTTDRHEFYYTIVISAVKGSEPQMVFGDDPSIVNGVSGEYGIRTIDGRRIGFYSGIQLKRDAFGSNVSRYVFDHGRPTLYSVDFSDMRTRRVAKPALEGFRSDWAIDARGEVAATLTVKLQNGSWKIVNSDNKTLAEGVNLTGGISLMGFGQDGSTLLYSREDEDAGETYWYEVPLDGSTAPAEFLPDVDAQNVYFDPETGQYVGHRIRGEDRVMIDPKASKAFAAVRRAFSKLQVSFRDWTRDFTTMLVRTDGNMDSGTWFRVDLKAGKADAIGYERMRIEPEQVGPISTFAYKASDGLDLDGILTLPPGVEAKNLPAVMLPHGGPHGEDREGFDWWAQALASRGYAVFQPNFRGSTNRDTAFEHAGYGQWGRKMQTDISEGLAALAKAGIVDPARACIVGASYGGYAALAGVTIEQGKYRCAVAVAPVVDLALMTRLELREVNGKRTGMTGRVLEEMLGPRSGFDAVSPMKLADRADAPILLIHGRDDTVVPYLHSQKMADALKDADKPYKFVDLREEDHWLSKGETRLQMLEETVAFVEKYNPPK